MSPLQAYGGQKVARVNSDLPALELLIEIELEDGSQDSLLRALDYQQGYCRREEDILGTIIDIIETGGPVVWYRPGSYLTRWIKLRFIEVRLLEGPALQMPCLTQA